MRKFLIDQSVDEGCRHFLALPKFLIQLGQPLRKIRQSIADCLIFEAVEMTYFSFLHGGMYER
ncbi:hypothetical protein ACKFKF_05695 [Phormidesmis sp. 146-12]